MLQAAHELAVNAEPTADKLSEAVVGAAEQAGEQAQVNADKAEKLLRDNAQKLASEAPARADEVRSAVAAIQQVNLAFELEYQRYSGQKASAAACQGLPLIRQSFLLA